MTTLSILEEPNTKLRLISSRVEEVDEHVRALMDAMVEVMRENRGVGLAAPQVDVQLRVVVMQVPGEPLHHLVNPQIVDLLGSETYGEEECLSCPGRRVQVRRNNCVTIRFQDRLGAEAHMCMWGLQAIVIQHEIDHLDGMLITDQEGDKG